MIDKSGDARADAFREPRGSGRDTGVRDGPARLIDNEYNSVLEYVVLATFYHQPVHKYAHTHCTLHSTRTQRGEERIFYLVLDCHNPCVARHGRRTDQSAHLVGLSII